MTWIKNNYSPGAIVDLAGYIRDETRNGHELADFALKVFRDPMIPLRDKWAAMCWLADRGFGKPVANLQIESKGQSSLGLLADLTFEQLQEAEATICKLLEPAKDPIDI